MRKFVFGLILAAAACDSTEDTTTPGGGGGALQGTMYIGAGTGDHIFRLDLGAGTYKQLGIAREPEVAPDGKLIATDGLELFESDETLAAHRPINRFSSDIERSNKAFFDFQVDPTGQKIAYCTQNHDLYVLNRADGTVVARNEPTVTSITSGWYRPTWLPDGRIVAAGGFANQGLFLFDADLTNATRIDPGLSQPAEPAVSPDGTKIAFTLNRRLHVINLDGTGLAPLVEDDEENSYPTWSPDGTQIAYRVSGRVMIKAATGGAAIDLFEAGFKDLGDKHYIFTGYQFAWTK